MDDRRQLAKYVHMGRKNSVRLDGTLLEEIDPASALYLPANNSTARINYALIAAAHVNRFIASLPQSAPVFWVTLIAERYTVGQDDAGDFDPFPLQQWARQELRRCSFIGMVEAALFTNVGVVKAGMKRAVSWHAHLLVWDVTASQIEAVCDRINERFVTMIPGVKAAHFRALGRKAVEGQTFYMLKAPVNDYRIIKMMKEVIDGSTGEVTKEPTGRFKTRKYQLASGNLARMAIIMSGKTLNKLAFAAGEGKALLKAINDKALARRDAATKLERSREGARRTGFGKPRRGPQSGHRL